MSKFHTQLCVNYSSVPNCANCREDGEGGGKLQILEKKPSKYI